MGPGGAGRAKAIKRGAMPCWQGGQRGSRSSREEGAGSRTRGWVSPISEPPGDSRGRGAGCCQGAGPGTAGGSLRRGGKGMVARVQSHRESPPALQGSDPHSPRLAPPAPPPTGVLTAPGLSCLSQGCPCSSRANQAPVHRPSQHCQQKQGQCSLHLRHVPPTALWFSFPSKAEQHFSLDKAIFPPPPPGSHLSHSHDYFPDLCASSCFPLLRQDTATPFPPGNMLGPRGDKEPKHPVKQPQEGPCTVSRPPGEGRWLPQGWSAVPAGGEQGPLCSRRGHCHCRGSW